MIKDGAKKSTRKHFVLSGGGFGPAEEGFEPSQTESESVVLPLHNSAILYYQLEGTSLSLTVRIIISRAFSFVKRFFKKI